MLEQFEIPTADSVRVSHHSLRRTTAGIFEKMGERPEDAELAADTLVSADLRGISTHGVSITLKHYIDFYRDGTIKARPDWHTIRERPGIATINADRGLGIILGHKAMRIAISKAKNAGVGIVNLFNSAHSGAIGHFAMLAAKEDMVGVCMTAAGLYVCPTFASETRLGTNPIAIAAPARHEAPFLFDAATSLIAWNKVALAKQNGGTLLPGWVSDSEGIPILNETQPLELGEQLPLPLGGTREYGSHKGYGLAMMAEVLTTLLSGAIPTMLEEHRTDKHYFAAYDIAAFCDVNEFKNNMDNMLRELKNTPTVPGQNRVLYAGLPEHEEEKRRSLEGIPLHRDVVRWFAKVSRELRVPELKTL